MRRPAWWLDVGPAILIGGGMIISTVLVKHDAVPGLLTLAGELVLALAVISADVFHSRLKGQWAGPSWASLFLAASFLFAGLVVTVADPSIADSLIPLIGTASLLLLVMGPKRSATHSKVAPSANSED